MTKSVRVGGFILTEAQADALRWLFAHNGDGARQRGNTVLAGGEIGPHQPQTWARLVRLRLAEDYKSPCCGRRIRLTRAGRAVAEMLP